MLARLFSVPWNRFLQNLRVFTCSKLSLGFSAPSAEKTISSSKIAEMNAARAEAAV